VYFGRVKPGYDAWLLTSKIKLTQSFFTDDKLLGGISNFLPTQLFQAIST